MVGEEHVEPSFDGEKGERAVQSTSGVMEKDVDRHSDGVRDDGGLALLC